ncbi:hypothetical protein PHYPSEUDO_002437 [Phytophthora pseudosyringae]|uniref:Restriction endonuclease type IV Mrr domain-containing protein n=1 Tax=Phytophthora pseudosyringae TaxID=221518 RepID=A0A8T1VXD9_9STRA|nr:hypothetical protein PHYPSEUDO_002437 [Phytophthora pseudosyringae]
MAAPAWRRCCFLARASRPLPRARNGVAQQRNLSTAPGISDAQPVSSTNREKGLAFEEQVVTLMQSLNCELQATQQSRDGGIDHHVSTALGDCCHVHRPFESRRLTVDAGAVADALQGSWTLPDLAVDVVTQCKNEGKPVGVHYVREFHGVLGFFPPATVGLFASASGYSLYAQRFFLRMTHPAILCSVDTDSGHLTSFLLNDRAQTLLPKLTVGSLFVNQDHALVLTYGDKILG